MEKRELQENESNRQELILESMKISSENKGLQGMEGMDIDRLKTLQNMKLDRLKAL